MVYKVLKQSDETKSLAKHLKRIIKYVKKEISVLRASLYQQVGVEKAPDRKINLQIEAKRALAIEKLFLSLSLVTALPDDLEQISEQLEEIVDLQECFKNLKIGDVAK